MNETGPGSGSDIRIGNNTLPLVPSHLIPARRPRDTDDVNAFGTLARFSLPVCFSPGPSGHASHHLHNTWLAPLLRKLRQQRQRPRRQQHYTTTSSAPGEIATSKQALGKRWHCHRRRPRRVDALTSTHNPASSVPARPAPSLLALFTPIHDRHRHRRTSPWKARTLPFT